MQEKQHLRPTIQKNKSNASKPDESQGMEPSNRQLVILNADEAQRIDVTRSHQLAIVRQPIGSKELFSQILLHITTPSNTNTIEINHYCLSNQSIHQFEIHPSNLNSKSTSTSRIIVFCNNVQCDKNCNLLVQCDKIDVNDAS